MVSDNGLINSNTNTSKLMIRQRISNICELWTLEELVKIDDEDMDRILTFYGASKVPSFDDIYGKSNDVTQHTSLS